MSKAISMLRSRRSDSVRQPTSITESAGGDSNESMDTRVGMHRRYGRRANAWKAQPV